MINIELYIYIPSKITDIITNRSLRKIGQCIRHDDEAEHDLIVWHPMNGKSNRRRRIVYRKVILVWMIWEKFVMQ